MALYAIALNGRDLWHYVQLLSMEEIESYKKNFQS